ncbi:MAG: tRNA (N(6)-L-threonylcarbamoyladenosine(37)-C(2))-methylthiotransferase MtaB [Bacteroidales bacterium]|nr:tRNA (N(6)-L-threonylcarbamoyladenosine(37)-C(2))-methylthiotransferase MtaB [Bacteroidales bacterium]
MERRNIAYFTLGCKLNFSETSYIATKLEVEGYNQVSFNQKADYYVIHTCTVTQAADRKSRQLIRKISRKNPEAVIVAMGCYAQVKPEELSSISEVDIILGTAEKFNLGDYLKDYKKGQPQTISISPVEEAISFNPAYSGSDRTRSFLKIQDGCDYTCTYCTIPLARGKSRSPCIKDIVLQAKDIAGKGVKEIILTGVNIGDFGKLTGESFLDLLKELDKVHGIHRFRISSIEPNLLEDNIIHFAARSNRIAPHFHIPLQSGSDRILKLMQRRYTTELFQKRIYLIRKVIPDAGIGIDVIIGFPGETDTDFTQTYEFLNQLDISYLHVFTYSDRNNTKSVIMRDKVNPAIKEQRSKLLHELSEKKRKLFYSNQLGKIASVLFEAKKYNGRMSGYTENYIKVEKLFDIDDVGSVLKVRLLNMNENGNVNVEVIE